MAGPSSRGVRRMDELLRDAKGHPSWRSKVVKQEENSEQTCTYTAAFLSDIILEFGFCHHTLVHYLQFRQGGSGSSFTY